PDATTGVMDAGTITLSAGKTLTGQVTRGGSGLADVQVFAWPTLDSNGRPMGPPSGGSATTDGNGNYTITGVLGGMHYDISAQPSDGTAGKFTKDAVIILADTDSTSYNVSLGAGGNIALHVQDASSFASIAGAHVDCFNPTLHAGRGAETDAGGNASLIGLAAGTYECRAFAPTYEPTSVSVEVASDATTTTTLDLTGGVVYTRVTGTYSTGNSTSADGLLVVVVPNGTIGSDETTGFNRTVDASGTGTGTFVIGGLPEAAYDVRIISTDGTLLAKRDNISIAGAEWALDPLTYGDNLGG
ncbi:MAG: carboxypeptidase-like regulatory domain-containing protein, partial [Candidatus Thermoplasmatota archaeon]